MAAELVVGVTNFIAESKASKEALKSSNILKSLNINALIEGESGVGKLTLAKSILGDALIIDSSNIDELEEIADNSNIIIKNFNKLGSLYKFKKIIESKSIRVIATTREPLREEIFDNFFSVKLYLPPLSERVEDIKPLAKEFLKEAQEVFGSDKYFINLDSIEFDLSENAYSLKRSIFLASLFKVINDNDILKILEYYFSDKLGSDDDYRKFLYLYEVPLIKVALKKFKSQLKVSEKLGINRNTLRKKINSYKEIL